MKKPMAAAVELGRRGGLARKRKVSKSHLSAIGKVGALIRWTKARRGSAENKSSQLRGS
jgi:hypothetical protein